MADTVATSGTPSGTPVAIFKKRGAKGKANLRKRPATPPPAADSDASDFSSSEDESGQRIKRRRKNTAVVKASSKNNATSGEDVSATTIYEADRDVTLDSSKRDATKGSNWFDEQGQSGTLSAKSLLGSTRAMPNKKNNDGTEAQAPDGTYKGLANQASYIQRNPNAPSRTVGPIKAPTNIRTITITDMAPDVCKDVRLMRLNTARAWTFY